MSKKRLRISLLVGIAAWILLGGAPRATSAQEPGRYTSREKGFSIKLPADWERKEGMLGTVVVALSPQAIPADPLRANVNVVTEDLPKALTLDEYVAVALASLRKGLTDFEEQEKSPLSVANTPAMLLIFSYQMQNVKVKAMQCILVKGTRAYVITYGATPDQFADHRAKFDEIVRSFRFEP